MEQESAGEKKQLAISNWRLATGNWQLASLSSSLFSGFGRDSAAKSAAA
jgi:hypothetical protein